jgi:hypothetical protein
MLKPSLRLFILPLGAVSMIATMASQNAPQATRDTATQQVRQELVACSAAPKADLCIVSEKAAR